MASAVHPATPDAAAIRSAVGELTPTTPRRWGTLDAPGMLEHMCRFNEVYLGERETPLLVRALARLFGRPFVRKFLRTSPFEMPRSMRTLPALAVEASDTHAAEFERLRSRFLSTFDRLQAVEGIWRHPLYGKLDAETGRALVRHHAAHHLHQFGVLEPPASTRT